MFYDGTQHLNNAVLVFFNSDEYNTVRGRSKLLYILFYLRITIQSILMWDQLVYL